MSSNSNSRNLEDISLGGTPNDDLMAATQYDATKKLQLNITKCSVRRVCSI